MDAAQRRQSAHSCHHCRCVLAGAVSARARRDCGINQHAACSRHSRRCGRCWRRQVVLQNCPHKSGCGHCQAAQPPLHSATRGHAVQLRARRHLIMLANICEHRQSCLYHDTPSAPWSVPSIQAERIAPLAATAAASPLIPVTMRREEASSVNLWR